MTIYEVQELAIMACVMFLPITFGVIVGIAFERARQNDLRWKNIEAASDVLEKAWKKGQKQRSNL